MDGPGLLVVLGGESDQSALGLGRGHRRFKAHQLLYVDIQMILYILGLENEVCVLTTFTTIRNSMESRNRPTLRRDSSFFVFVVNYKVVAMRSCVQVSTFTHSIDTDASIETVVRTRLLGEYPKIDGVHDRGKGALTQGVYL